MEKNFTEKSVKRFLKKRGRYTLGVLVNFLITGSFVFAIPNADVKVPEEILRTEFYKKSQEKSDQIFFPIRYKASSENKDRTSSQFSDLINESNQNGLNGKDEVVQGNGVVVKPIKPDKPVNPDNPDKPVNPDNPNKPVNPDNPNKPVNPDNPNKPVNPDNPNKPVNPDNPNKPVNPDNPNKPVNPDNPDKPVNPDNPDKPVNPDNPDKPSNEIKDKIDEVLDDVDDKIKNIEDEIGPGKEIADNVKSPNRFKINSIRVPEEPKVSAVTVPKLTHPHMNTFSSGNADGVWYWSYKNPNTEDPKYDDWGSDGENATISEVIMEKGNWDINIKGDTETDGWSGQITDYTAKAADCYKLKPIKDKTFKTHGVIGKGKAGIYRVIGSPYSSFEKDTVVNIDATGRTMDFVDDNEDQEVQKDRARRLEYRLRQFIHYDPHGEKAKNRLEDIKEMSKEELAEAKSLYDDYKLYSNGIRHNSMVLSLKGTINLKGNGINIVGLQGHEESKETDEVKHTNPYLLHSGKINVEGNSNVVFAYTQDLYSYVEKRDYFISNYGDGEINIKDGKNNYMLVFNKKYAEETQDSHNFRNSGVMKIEGGENNVGIYVKREIQNGTIDLQTPLQIAGGKGNVAMYHQSSKDYPERNIINEKSVLKFDILGGENNFGLIDETEQSYSKVEINLDNSLNSVGVASKKGIEDLGKLNIEDGLLKIGSKNENGIGFLTENGGSIKTNTLVEVNGGKANTVALARKNSSITLENSIKVDGAKDSILFTTEGKNSKVEIKEKMDVNATGDSVIAAALNGMINISSKENELNISNSKGESKGIGLYASQGGKVLAQNNTIKVENGKAGVAAIGEGSSIDISNGRLDYSGDGYALYNDGGNIKLEDGEVILRENGTGMELDFSKGNSGINLKGSKITMMSNNAVVALLKNVQEDLNVSTLRDKVENAIGTLNVQSGTDSNGNSYDSYKIAAVDGANINIDTDIKINNTQDGKDTSEEFYYKRVVAQRGTKNLLAGKTIDVQIDSENANRYYNGQIIGMEATSSNLAKSNDETKVNLKEGTKINVDRTDAGNGAVGVYINYGKLTAEKGSEILVENGDNTINNGGIGIYALNGSEVNSEATIKVNGNEAVGIYGRTNRYAEDGKLLVDEFGKDAKGQNKVFIKNNGNIIVSGENSIGILANNNNGMKNKSDSIVENNGTIHIGKKGNEKISFGIVGAGSKITNNGTIIAEGNTAGILGLSGTDISKIGDIVIKDSGIGVVAKFGTTVKADNTISLKGKDSIAYYIGKDSKMDIDTDISMASKNSNGNIFAFQKDGSRIDVADGTTISIDGIEMVGDKKSFAGFYLDGTEAANTLNLSKGSVLNVSNGGVGVYSKEKNNINLAGEINLIDRSIGAIARGENSVITNTGVINVNQGIGMVAKEGAVAINKGTINVKEGIGMLSYENSTVENRGVITIENGAGLAGYGKVINSGNIKITGKGVEILDKDYITNGGKLESDKAIELNGAIVNIMSDEKLFEAPEVGGNIRVASDFALVGNGINYRIDNFTKDILGSKTNDIVAKTSELFDSSIDSEGNLNINKVPYRDLTIGNKFDALEDGLDDLLAKGNYDSIVLKNMNKYLDGLNEKKFETETERCLSEARGDIYTTLQKRMEDINQAFDYSFDEMNSSYNKTKEVNKYSVIYSGGNFKDGTVGIDGYDYDSVGLMYMKDYDGKEYGAKHGYYLGFAVSNFDFDHSESSEKVYSVKTGLHKTTPFLDNTLSLLSKLEVGYNRHKTERVFNLDRRYKNVARINSYTVAFDNKLTKNLFRDLDTEINIYTGLDLEYGKIGAFNEHGVLELRGKENDYFSTKGKFGLDWYHRFYLKNDVALKPIIKAEYSYEFGDYYPGNEMKVKESSHGYYKLINPAKEKGIVSGTFGIALEKVNHYGVTFDVEVAKDENRKEEDVTYNLRFNYKI